MKYIVLDMEWNQAHSSRCVDSLPMPLSGEIIQIGAVKIGEDGAVEDTLRLNIKPCYYTKLHSGVRKLTGITAEDLANGLLFPDAAHDLKKWCGEEFTLFIWGFDDIAVLGENMAIWNLDFSWIPPCYNLQFIYCAQTGSEKRQWTLTYAAEVLGITLDIPAHDALNDALYTAALLQKMDIKRGMAEYDPADLLTLDEQFKVVDHIVLSGFATKQEAQASRKVRTIPCPICGERMKYDGFYRQNKSKRVSLPTCSLHGDYFCRIQFLKCENGSYRVLRTLYEADEKAKKYYTEKRDAALAAEEKAKASAKAAARTSVHRRHKKVKESKQA
ncbi:MAG: exonuclease domain-containing protein [Clostridia bacterium]|nr:exonuclease domain-containing protein [Clostridia bacterium]